MFGKNDVVIARTLHESICSAPNKELKSSAITSKLRESITSAEFPWALLSTAITL